MKEGGVEPDEYTVCTLLRDQDSLRGSRHVWQWARKQARPRCLATPPSPRTSPHALTLRHALALRHPLTSPHALTLRHARTLRHALSRGSAGGAPHGTTGRRRTCGTARQGAHRCSSAWCAARCNPCHPGCNLMHARLKQRLQPTEQTGCLVS